MAALLYYIPMIRLTFFFLAIGFAFGTSQAAPLSDSTKAKVKPTMTISEVLKKHTDDWMKISGVIGTGETIKDEKPAIMIFVMSLTTKIKKSIPKTVDGYPVLFQETGEIKAQ